MMTSRFRWMLYGCISSVFLSFVLSGCGVDPQQEAMLSEQQALQSQPTEIGCGQSMSGKISDMYQFRAKQGYQFVFSAKANQWVYLSITDTNTGKTLFRKFGIQSLSVALTPSQHTIYSIFVWGAKHTLTAQCNLLKDPHCVIWETTDEQGNPYRNFYAQNVNSYAEGKAVLAREPHFIEEAIQRGTCLAVAKAMACPRAWIPVCSDTPQANTTWGNVCEFKRHVQEKAGDSGQWKGHWDPGQCKTPHCVEWEATDAQGKPIQNFYAQNVDSYAAGKDVLNQFKYFTNESIRPGTCISQNQTILCQRDCPGICADSPRPNTNYCNVCMLKNHVRQQAGDTGQWKTHWEKGACKLPSMCGGIAGFPCPAGYKCKLEGDYPDAAGTCQPVICKYDGQEYIEGEGFKATDGCNRCTCMASGMVACTKMACPAPCDPQKEWWRKYVTTTPDQCQVIRFTCPANTTYFSNACGCGCEQSTQCPQWINCMPPTDCSAERARCPFSKIAW